jgi:uncharacterized protein (DUF302 family)
MMQRDNLYAAETVKGVDHFVRDLGEASRKYGFVVHNEDKMAMADTFGAHGLEVAAGFDLHMVQLCKPEKAAKSLGGNPERAVLMPKFVMVFSKDGATQVRFLRYGADDIRAVVDDGEFPGSLADTFAKIVEMIEEAR